MSERDDGWNDPADEGWGGTADEAWGSSRPPTPGYAAPPPEPAAPAYTPPPAASPPLYPTAPEYGQPGYQQPGYQQQGYPPATPPSAPPPHGGRKAWYYAGGGAVVIAVVVAIVLLASGGGKGKASPSPSVSASASASASAIPSPSASASASATPSAPAGTGLAAIAPFTGCTNAPAASFNTPKVTEQIVCTGTDVTSKVSALGVSYAKFPSTADLNSWYSDTILKANGITQNLGQCSNGSLVNTTRGAQYCEGAFTDDTGATARQVLVEAPKTIELTNGPNNTSANCPGQSFTLLVFTSPSDNVGVVALGCPASPVTAKTFETSLNNGDFDLND